MNCDLRVVHAPGVKPKQLKHWRCSVCGQPFSKHPCEARSNIGRGYAFAIKPEVTTP